MFMRSPLFSTAVSTIGSSVQHPGPSNLFQGPTTQFLGHEVPESYAARLRELREEEESVHKAEQTARALEEEVGKQFTLVVIGKNSKRTFAGLVAQRSITGLTTMMGQTPQWPLAVIQYLESENGVDFQFIDVYDLELGWVSCVRGSLRSVKREQVVLCRVTGLSDDHEDVMEEVRKLRAAAARSMIRSGQTRMFNQSPNRTPKREPSAQCNVLVQPENAEKSDKEKNKNKKKKKKRRRSSDGSEAASAEVIEITSTDSSPVIAMTTLPVSPLRSKQKEPAWPAKRTFVQVYKEAKAIQAKANSDNVSMAAARKAVIGQSVPKSTFNDALRLIQQAPDDIVVEFSDGKKLWKDFAKRAKAAGTGEGPDED
ncbi:hypothetical protein CALCODRAFT_539647 [Calocera cornea HHB12733]|uniref:Uncharacterized protein n=1 Tax=Calocera cornea HHB12733 TaxID=1353952 RepID=A0A165AMN5_9BASI|nr:hypothetical protein CALCODRAFT_539647 [Calocera cornea HHB12733]